MRSSSFNVCRSTCSAGSAFTQYSNGSTVNQVKKLDFLHHPHIFHQFTKSISCYNYNCTIIHLYNYNRKLWIIQRKPWRDAFAESIEKFWIKANQLDWIFHKVWIKSAWAEIEMQPMTSSLMMLEWSLRTSAVKVKVKIAPHQLWCHQWCHWCAKVTP